MSLPSSPPHPHLGIHVLSFFSSSSHGNCCPCPVPGSSCQTHQGQALLTKHPEVCFLHALINCDDDFFRNWCSAWGWVLNFSCEKGGWGQQQLWKPFLPQTPPPHRMSRGNFPGTANKEYLCEDVYVCSLLSKPFFPPFFSPLFILWPLSD